MYMNSNVWILNTHRNMNSDIEFIVFNLNLHVIIWAILAVMHCITIICILLLESLPMT